MDLSGVILQISLVLSMISSGVLAEYMKKKYTCYVCSGDVKLDQPVTGHCFDELSDNMIQHDCVSCVKIRGKDEYSNIEFVQRSCDRQIFYGLRLVTCADAHFAGVTVTGCHCKGNTCNSGVMLKPAFLLVLLSLAAWKMPW